jgi:phosphoglycerol transferase MdoB-like AlkP superfamily enzyme
MTHYEKYIKPVLLNAAGLICTSPQKPLLVTILLSQHLKFAVNFFFTGSSKHIAPFIDALKKTLAAFATIHYRFEFGTIKEGRFTVQVHRFVQHFFSNIHMGIFYCLF